MCVRYFYIGTRIMEFDLRFLEPESRMFIQHAIDGVNKAATVHDPGAWNFVSAGGLIQANKERGYKKLSDIDPIAVTVFEEMEQDGHSGATAHWTISTVTQIAKNYRNWRDWILVNSLIEMKDELNDFIQGRFKEKFPGEDLEWHAAQEKVLHDLEYSYLAQHIINDDGKRILQFLLKMEDVSHLGNEVLLEQIEEQLKVL